MLVLSRMRDEQIVIGGLDSGIPEIRLTLVDIRGDKVRIGIAAPTEIPVHRAEVYAKVAEEKGLSIPSTITT